MMILIQTNAEKGNKITLILYHGIVTIRIIVMLLEYLQEILLRLMVVIIMFFVTEFIQLTVQFLERMLLFLNI